VIFQLGLQYHSTKPKVSFMVWCTEATQDPVLLLRLPLYFKFFSSSFFCAFLFPLSSITFPFLQLSNPTVFFSHQTEILGQTSDNGTPDNVPSRYDQNREYWNTMNRRAASVDLQPDTLLEGHCFEQLPDRIFCLHILTCIKCYFTAR
jgi:hypothetical protein